MRSLDRCPHCEAGRFKVYKTRTRGSLRTRFLKCVSCNATSKEHFRVDHLGRQVSFEVCTAPGTEVAHNMTGGE